jgi:hypothetical protein
MQDAIYWPMVAQAGLTAVVSVLMYARRIDPQSGATNRTAAGVLEDVTAADNLRNLLEMPVLFFAVCLCLAVTERAGSLQLTLAWSYVGLRVVHSVIHVTYNRVVPRFVVYVLSTFCLFAMWAIFAASLL